MLVRGLRYEFRYTAGHPFAFITGPDCTPTNPEVLLSTGGALTTSGAMCGLVSFIDP